MVCNHCRDAGDALNRMLTPVPGETNTDRVLFRVALAAHGRCRGGTWCDCAHVVPGIENIRIG